MLFPIRCFSCGQVIADKYDEYRSRVEGGEKPADVLNKLNIKRYCCRRMFLSHVEVFDEIVEFHSGFSRRSE